MLDIANQAEMALKTVVDLAGVQCERTVEGVTETIGLEVFAGQSSDEVSIPCMIISAQEAREYPQGSGNWNLTIQVELQASMDDMNQEQFSAASKAAMTLLMADDLAAVASSKRTNFHIFGISDRNCRFSRVDRSYITALTMNLYCCGLDIT